MGEENIGLTAVIIYFAVVAGLAAIAAATAIEEDDRAGLPARVAKSITRTSGFLGGALVFGTLALLAIVGKGTGGIMSGEMALVFVAGLLFFGWFMAWVGCLALGVLGAKVARTLPATLAALVVFVATASGAPAAWVFVKMRPPARVAR